MKEETALRKENKAVRCYVHVHHDHVNKSIAYTCTYMYTHDTYVVHMCTHTHQVCTCIIIRIVIYVQLSYLSNSIYK